MRSIQSTSTHSPSFYGPHLLKNHMQISSHRLSKVLQREMKQIFPDLELNEVKAIVTMQHSKYELVRFDTLVDQEKDNLLENFFEFASEICEVLQARGHWADYIDPCSGLPMNGTTNTVYNEVGGAEALLGYRCMNAGCCKVLLHPLWGSAVYPATMFTNAPEDEIQEVLERYLECSRQKSTCQSITKTVL